MNPVLMLMYNQTHEQLELSKHALDSVLAQDIPVHLHVVDNGSTEPTWDWLYSLRVPNMSLSCNEHNVSPVKVSNEWCARIFAENDYLLTIPNDVRLPRNCYSEMLRWPRGFVSASDNGHNEPIEREAKAVSECTPMAVMLTRKWAYDAIVAKDGYFFDENFFLYASDCDLALRMAACGIRGVQLDIPFWHYGSAGWRLSTPDVAQGITAQADVDRAYFEQKWGFSVSDPRYSQSAQDINFRGESNG